MSENKNVKPSEYKDLVDAATNPITKDHNILLEELFEKTDEILPETGLEAIAPVLALEGDAFKTISEMTLNEMEKALNDPNEKMMMVQGLNASGVAIEELNQMFADLIQAIDKDMTPYFPKEKVSFLKRVIAIIVNAVNDTQGIAKKVVHVAFEIIDERAKKPTYANSGDAGMDIFAIGDYDIAPGETKLIHTGIKTAIPLGYELQVRPKSGISLKTKLRVANTPGTIDCNYRGEICIIVENVEPPIKSIETRPVKKDGKLHHLELLSIEYGRSFHIEDGQKIAQLVLKDNPMAVLYETNDVSEIGEDRAGGFGSTGLY